MRNPNEKGPEEVPPGGRAFERVQQDRIARGLGELPPVGTSGLEKTKTITRRQAKKTKPK